MDQDLFEKLRLAMSRDCDEGDRIAGVAAVHELAAAITKLRCSLDALPDGQIRIVFPEARDGSVHDGGKLMQRVINDARAITGGPA